VLYTNPDRPFSGRLVSVIGAKGGAGASTIAHNLSWTLAERCGANTTLVDLDVPFGTAALDFNQGPSQTVADALGAPDRVDPIFLDRLLVRQTERLLIFSAPGSLDRDFEFDAEAYEVLIDAVRRTAPFVVLDLPHMWTHWVRDALVSSDAIVLVATPELASLRNAKNMLERLERLRRNDAPPHVVLNMTGIAKRPEIPAKDFGEALGCPLSAVIPFEPAVFGLAANNGQMLAEIGAPSRSAEAMDMLANVLSGRAPQAQKSASILDKLPFLRR
jgi:pilus assembly protein CpaE